MVPEKTFLEKLSNVPHLILRKIRRAIRLLLDFIAYHYYAITTNGLEVSKRTKDVWSTKWAKPSNLRMLLVAPKDYAGSFYGWAKAVNQFSPDVACRVVSLYKHRYGYDRDYVYHSFRRGIEDHDEFKKLVDEADGLHLKDEFYFHQVNWRPEISKFILLLIEEFRKKNKPVIFTHYGSFARRFGDDPSYQRAVLDFDARIALTPDLNYDWFNGHYVPHSVNLDRFPYTWSASKVFAHSPSSRSLKGSDLMLKALHKIDEINREWKVDIIEHVRYEKCLERKSKAELFFDQAGKDETDKKSHKVIGWYGNSAVEAMAFGIPTIVHLSETAIQQAKKAGKDLNASPILNTGINEESMKETVSKYLHMSEDNRRKLSQATRLWVEEFHGEAVIGRQLADIYQRYIKS